ncbi:hypothetical protein DPMN_175972 [Dreissena polymorpha]|uniref:Uncharacterized protein n=1 Tax=Dreissena polymorpha TaxID=45954 RepID=A0A9D4IHQ1_DREPO|nr:hypothetical protein DPMN_175972 [Dreissena polymorpha]
MKLRTRQLLTHFETSSVSSNRTSCNPSDSVPKVRLNFFRQLTAIITVLHIAHKDIGKTSRSLNFVFHAASLVMCKQNVYSILKVRTTWDTRRLAQTQDIRLKIQNLENSRVCQRESVITFAKRTSTWNTTISNGDAKLMYSAKYITNSHRPFSNKIIQKCPNGCRMLPIRTESNII